ncbi:MAG: hypothetical protein H6825_07250 [Planctomycetes bacterium]|nr:hypothetical protein [Planctomycetota bacterium]
MSATRRPQPLTWTDLGSSREGARATHVFGTTIPRDWLFFEGHFRGYPVLAGVVQLHDLVLPCVRAVRPDVRHAAGLRGVKFPSRIQPGDAITVTLALDDDARSVDFAIRRGEALCTHGRLLLAGAGT